MNTELNTALRAVRAYRLKADITDTELRLVAMACASVIAECLIVISGGNENLAFDHLDTLVSDIWKRLDRSMKRK